METKTRSAYVLAFLIGCVISIMVSFNAGLGSRTSSEVSTIVNQVVGIVTLEVIMLLGRNNTTINPRREKARWYMYFGGFFGIAILSINYVSIMNAGATVAMAGAVFGQSFFGFLVDTFGLFSMEKRKITRKKVASLLVSALGIAMMVFGRSLELVYLLLSMLAGALTMMQMIYNSNLSKKKGAFFSARNNVISGLVAALLYAYLLFPETTSEGFKTLSSAPLYIILGGGMLACIVVVGTNIIIPKIPAAYSALLLSSGQILAAVLLDYLLYDIFTPGLLSGALVMLFAIIALRD